MAITFGDHLTFARFYERNAGYVDLLGATLTLCLFSRVGERIEAEVVRRINIVVMYEPRRK